MVIALVEVEVMVLLEAEVTVMASTKELHTERHLHVTIGPLSLAVFVMDTSGVRSTASHTRKVRSKATVTKQ